VRVNFGAAARAHVSHWERRSASGLRRPTKRRKMRAARAAANEYFILKAAAPQPLRNALSDQVREAAKDGLSFRNKSSAEDAEPCRASPVELDAVDDDQGLDSEIRRQFRLRLAQLRLLPRHERAYALRAAREWHGTALKALRDKRAGARRP